MGPSQDAIFNPIGEALARRIECAIYDAQPFHVYMVIPVHPEGALNTINIMTQVHMTMQSIVLGSHSLVNRIRRAIVVAHLCKSKKISRKHAMVEVEAYNVDEIVKIAKESWMEYLTLLNLRTSQLLEKRSVTEQIYVHSKLLIADDRVAVLGSANINDRSQLGNRDSELAVIIRDDEKVSVRLDGVHQEMVSENVHRLRIQLWRKLFGLSGGIHPAQELAKVIEKPAAKETWESVQRVSFGNALAYQNAFPFVPKVNGERSSIWPMWNETTRKLNAHMPFNERFWRKDDVMDQPSSWDAKSSAVEMNPVGVRGFIVALPVSWTAAENNSSGMNLTLLANALTYGDVGQAIAASDGGKDASLDRWS